MKNQEILEKIMRLKKDVLFGFGLCFVSYIVLIFILNLFYPDGRSPGWIVCIFGVLAPTIFIFPVTNKLTNIQCPRCGVRLKLNFFTNPAAITCLTCDNVINNVTAPGIRS